MNLFGWCRACSERCLPEYLQGFWYGFPWPPPTEMCMSWCGSVIHAVGWKLAAQPHLEGSALSLWQLPQVESPRERYWAQGCSVSSSVVWIMGSSGPRWSLSVIPSWVRQWTLWKGEPACRKTWTGWKIRLTRALWSSVRTNIRSCTWKNNPGEQHRLGIYLAKEQLYGRGPGGAGRQAVQCEQTVCCCSKESQYKTWLHQHQER